MANTTDREREIFSEALALENPEARAAYLRGACGADEPLRKRISELLEAHEEARGFIPTREIDAESTILLESPLSEGPGTKIGRYKLLQKIGEGGMGVVYMAEQEEPVRRRVALKIIKLGMDTRQVVARFEAERQALALMDHPNIAKVLDAGATESGRPFFVMELVKGVAITEYCDKNRLSMQHRLELFIPVCQAIQHAHLKGIIHRDVKPSNVMVTLHDGKPVPKVIDFGISKAINQRLTDKTLFTNYAQMIGTPAYMSPEQAEMSGLDVDTRTDVYALGVLLYELLTGTTPFPAKELLSLGYQHMQKVIVEREPPKPSTRLSTMADEELTVVAANRNTEGVSLRNHFKADLDWIVIKALEKDRTHRYETVTDMVADIHRHINNEPVSAVAPSLLYKLAKFCRRNRAAMAIATAFTLLLILGSIISIRFGLIANAQRQNAELANRRSVANEAAAIQAREQAENQYKAAERERKQAIHMAYAADMNLAWQAWHDNNFGKTRELLDRWASHTELQHFEYHRLDSLCQSDERATMIGRHPLPFGIQWLPDGKRFFTLGSRGRIIGNEGNPTNDLKLWDLHSGREIPITLPDDFGWCIDILADGKRFLTQSATRALKVWSWDGVTFSDSVAKIDAFEKADDAYFSDDGSLACVVAWASAKGDAKTQLGTVQIVDLQKRVTSFQFNVEFGGQAWWSSATPDLSKIAVKESPGKVSVWDTVSKRKLGSVSGVNILWNGLTISANGQYLATGDWDGGIRIWDLRHSSGESEEFKAIGPPLRGHSAWVSNLQFLPHDPLTLVSASADSTIRLWNVLKGTEIRKWRGHNDEVWVTRIAPDRKLLASASREGVIKVWSVEIPQEESPLLLESPLDIAFSRNGKQLIAAETVHDSSGASVRIRNYDFATLEEDLRARQVLSNSNPQMLLLSKSGESLVLVDSNQSVAWWDLDGPRQIAFKGVPLRVSKVPTLSGEEASCTSLSARGDILALGGNEPALFQVWQVTNNESALLFEKKLDSNIANLALSSQGHFLAVGHIDLSLSLWDVKAGRLVARRNQVYDIDPTGSLQFSSDDTVIVTTGDNAPKVWRYPDLAPILNLKAHSTGGRAVAFSGDMRRIAVPSDQDFFRIWDTTLQQIVSTIPNATEAARKLIFSPDGSCVVEVGSVAGRSAVRCVRAKRKS